LFVISGNAKNEYPKSNGRIKITGRLYSKGKKLENIESVFSGNTLSDTELSRLDIDSIKKRLSEHANQTNLFPTSDGEVPFMLVFSDLPDNVREYEIEAELLDHIQPD
jgi:hypothetical protein